MVGGWTINNGYQLLTDHSSIVFIIY